MNTCEPLAHASSRLYAGIVTERFVETCEFYFQHFGFTPEHIDADGALLLGPAGEHLMLLRADNPAQPAALRTATRGSGIWLRLIVPDASTLAASMAEAGVEIVADLHTSADGHPGFVARDPNGVLIHVTDASAQSSYPDYEYHTRHHHHDQSDRNSVHRLSRN